MSKQSELNFYISQLLGRLRLRTWLQGSTVLIITALATTVALVLILNHFAFPAGGVNSARFVLISALAFTAALSIVLPLLRLSTDRAVRQAEATYSGLEQRLTTFRDRQKTGDDGFLELLAADTLEHTRDAPPSFVAPNNHLFAIVGVGLGCLATLVWMVARRPGFIGYGAALLWTGEHKNTSPLYSLRVVPGNVTVRRNSNQLISARIAGLHPSNVQIFARYQSAKAWESVSMQAQPDLGEAANFQFVFAGLPENVDYYVKAGPLISPPYHVRVVDLPSIKKIHVTYQYPRWTGMESATQEQGGDLRAIEGTDAHIKIEMDKPLTDGKLTIDDNRTIPLSSAGPNQYTGTIRMKNDGSYHLSARDQGQPVRLSENYFIATDKAEPPQVSVTRPAGDYGASPIEEVTIRVQATAQFGLRNLHLHYSVNAGPDHDVSILKSQGAKNAEASHTVELEDYKLVPGDLVSIYATAQDGHAEARTDMSFVQVDPFRREFSQSQQSPSGGGGGGGQSSQNDMSKRQKELIAATWKQRKDKSPSAKENNSAAQFLADAQNKLRDQVTALSSRMNSRELSDANEEFTEFDRDMEQAASFMTPSAKKLKEKQWKDALPLEQRALQALLHAEATFSQIQVAFGQQAGGGGAGSSSAGRDLDSLFDLELDIKKNQYETAQNTSPVDKQQKDIDDVLAKLDTLAKRQDELSKQQNNSQQTFQERWQQEMLRRETEQLQRDMEQLARNRQQKSSAEQNQQSTSASSRSGSQKQQNSSLDDSSASSQNSVQDQRIQQALNRLREAGEAMKRNSEPQPGSDAPRRASDQLEQAKNLLGAHQQQSASGRLDSLSQEADRITQEERAQSGRIGQFASPEGGDSNKRQQSMQRRMQERNRLVEDRQQLSNDLTKLQQKLRESARIMAPIQPEAAEKLRHAITEMEKSDPNNHLQRSADRIRRGINPNVDGSESQITHQLEKLSQQLHEAQRSARRGQPNDILASTSDSRRATLDQLRRMRARLESFPGLKDQNARPKPEAEARNTTGVRTLPQATIANQSQQPPTSNRESRSSQRKVSAQSPSAPSGQGTDSGRLPNSSRANTSGAAGDRNTGSDTYASGPSGNAPSPTYGDAPTPEQVYRDQMQGLDRLGRMVHGDSDLSKQVSDLKRRIQQLDPERFHGNRELLEQLHREILSSIDRMEIAIMNEGSEAEARSGRSSVIPNGYQDAVADYYRRLSKSH
jgi:hypothetical protein